MVFYMKTLGFDTSRVDGTKFRKSKLVYAL